MVYELTRHQDGLHIGGGITLDNCCDWIEAGAEKVCHGLFPILWAIEEVTDSLWFQWLSI
jgi:hypothetical protein